MFCEIAGTTNTDNVRQTERYFIDRKKVNPDLFVIKECEEWGGLGL